MSDLQSFAKATRDALSGLYDSARLQTNPLVECLGVGAAEQGAAAALREILREVISSLEPDATVPSDGPEWLIYRMLWLRYIQSRNRFIIGDELGLGQASYYRYHRQGLEAVTDILWRRYQQMSLAEGIEPPDGQSSIREEARLRAIRLALRSRPQLVPVADLLQSSAEMIAPLLQQRNVRVEFHGAPERLAVQGDPAVLRQILLNILAETVQYATKGLVQIEMGLVSGAVRLQLSGLCATPADMLDATTGFRNSRGLLDEYGGSIEITYGAEGTAALEILIPSDEPTTILIIDDDADTIQLYCRYLQGHNYAIEIAQSADEARRSLAQSLPQIILLDVLMPKEDGWDILRYVKSKPAMASIPIIICSVLIQPELALAMGASAVLNKPITEDELALTIRRALGRADSAD
jgi:CheY-like chemotaxis protein